MAPASSAVTHPSLRLPLKICGLFDIGFAGGILDVTSMDSDASAALSGNPFSPEGLESADSALFDSLAYGSDDVSEALLNSLPPHLLSTLKALEEHFVTDLPATDSLDAFLNLDRMLDEDMPFDETADVNLFNPNPSLEKMICSLLGSESFSAKQYALPDIYNQEKAIKDVRSEPATPSLFEKPVFDPLLVTSTFNPNLNTEHAVKQDHRMAISFECVQKQTTIDGSQGRSNLLSIETIAYSDSSDSYIKKPITNRHAVSKKEKSVGFKKAKEKRKSKFYDLEAEAEMLVQENEKLRHKIIELEKMTKEMKTKLVAKIAGKYPVYSLN